VSYTAILPAGAFSKFTLHSPENLDIITVVDMSSNMLYSGPPSRDSIVSSEQGSTLADPKAHRRKSRTKLANPLQAGFAEFVKQHNSRSYNSSTHSRVEGLIPKSPKRYTLYPPLLLLPANVFTATPEWRDFHAGLSPIEKRELCACIAEAFRGRGLDVTHIAINAPIAAELETDPGESSSGKANVMRSPAGLVPLHGDWGPREVLGLVDGGGLVEAVQPTEEDFGRAFWVSAVQNGGVVQMWAPLWTMFSRGNVKEKARILGEGDRSFEGLDDGGANGLLGQELGDISVVDLFIGVGYFTFSYLRRGVGLVWGWEINGWSVEGLRRGCKRNGWRVEVLTVLGDGQVVDEQGREGDEALKGLAESFNMAQDEREGKAAIRCVVFHGDNKWSGETMTMVKDISSQGRVSGKWKNVRHVNLGLLPHARDSWEDSVRILDSEIGGWLHVHENVDVRDLQSRKDEIVKEIGKLLAADVAKRGQWETSCCHLEEVKTYAPGIMHCVFDIQVLPAR
jgi:tRNA wybutosine-synthesizing protein 2